MTDTDSGIKGPIAADISGEVFKLIAPGLLEWLRTQVFGKKMIVVGEPISGKTTFVNYLCTGELGDRDVDRGRTEHDKPPVKSVIQINQQTKFELRLKNIRDATGQVFEDTQAKWAVDMKPHVMMIFLKMNSGDRDTWLTNFLTAYASRLRNQTDQVALNTIQQIVLVLNMLDTIEGQGAKERVIAVKKQLKTIIKATLAPVFGRRTDYLLILKCILVETRRMRASSAWCLNSSVG